MNLLLLFMFAVSSAMLPPQPRTPPVKLETPKAALFTASLGSPMVTLKPTVLRIALGWNYTGPVDGFVVSYGSQSGVYTNAASVGTNTTFTLVKTNWTERKLNHYFVVAAQRGTNTSTFSNEVRFPKYPADHARVTWAGLGPVTLYASAALAPSGWQLLATISGASEYVEPLLSGARFYCSPQVKLALELFNPLN